MPIELNRIHKRNPADPEPGWDDIHIKAIENAVIVTITPRNPIDVGPIQHQMRPKEFSFDSVKDAAAFVNKKMIGVNTEEYGDGESPEDQTPEHDAQTATS